MFDYQKWKPFSEYGDIEIYLRNKALIDGADIESLIERYVILKRVSSNTSMGLCPFHDEEKPSFAVLKRRNRYHCFGCGSAGNIFDFIMKHDEISEREAIEIVKEHGKWHPNRGVPIAKESSY